MWNIRTAAERAGQDGNGESEGKGESVGKGESESEIPREP